MGFWRPLVGTQPSSVLACWVLALVVILSLSLLATALPRKGVWDDGGRPTGPYKRVAPDCGQATNCSVCTRKGGCGWCSRSSGSLNGSCVPGESSGPTNPETCSRWFYQSCHDLDLCKASTCDNCTALSNCGWCVSSKYCLPGNSTGPDSGQGAVCAKPYWVWEGNDCALEPTPDVTPTPSASPGSPSPSPSASPSASPSPSVSLSPSPSPSPTAWPSPSKMDLCPSFTNCSTCVAGHKCLWCLSSNACFNSTRTSNPCSGYYTNNCVDEFCANFTTCDECSRYSICGWCNYTKCVASDSNKPAYAKCTAFQYRSCAPLPCQQFGDCSLCTQPGNEHCAWCDPTSTCMPISNPPPRPGDPSCPFNWFWKECPAPVDCGMYNKSCVACTDFDTHCYWCTSSISFPNIAYCASSTRTGYTCMREQSQCTTAPSPSPRGGGSNGIGGGAIAGIVIGSVVGVAIITAAGLVWYRYYWRHRHYYARLE